VSSARSSYATRTDRTAPLRDNATRAVTFALAAVLVWAVGDRLVGHEDGWLKPLAVGAGVNGALALTAVGGVLSFAVGAAGFGAVLRDWLE